MSDSTAVPRAAIPSLLTGALVWGLVWFPFRALNEAGINGVHATTIVYGLAFLLLLPFSLRYFRPLRREGNFLRLALMGFTAGACTLGYVMAVLQAEVLRVLLLFYLAPLWTVFLSRFMLKEELRGKEWGVVALSLLGTAVLLWPDGSFAQSWPWPRNKGEWLGTAAGFFFALSNVLSRQLHEVLPLPKSLIIFAGIATISIVLAMLQDTSVSMMTLTFYALTPTSALLLLLLVFTMTALNLVVQFGLSHVTANRAILLLMLELVVTAVASWWLTHEKIGLHEIIGGLMIASAGIYAARNPKISVPATVSPSV